MFERNSVCRNCTGFGYSIALMLNNDFAILNWPGSTYCIRNSMFVCLMLILTVKGKHFVVCSFLGQCFDFIPEVSMKNMPST